MERACLLPFDRASFGTAPALSPLQGAAAAEPGRWTLELLRDKRMSPEEIARVVNDFLAGANPDAGGQRSESWRREAGRRSFG